MTRPVRVGAVYCVYNEDEYLAYSIRSILGFADRIFVLLGTAPYSAYNAGARRQFAAADHSEEQVAALARTDSRITLVKGVWDSELQHRNAGVPLCVRAGCTHYFLIDGDEVYRRDHLARLRAELAARPDVGQFIIKCDIFWRSFRYRILAEELAWMPRRVFALTRWSALGKTRIPVPVRTRFTGNNKTNSWGGVHHLDPAEVKFYHFSYARSPEKMREKLLTYSHAHEIRPGWFEDVWLRWPGRRDMTDLNPVDPPKFPRVVARDLADLPDIMASHPYYGREIIG